MLPRATVSVRFATVVTLTFKSHHGAREDWAMRELLAHHVACRKLVNSSPSDLLPTELFRLCVVRVRFPHNLSGQLEP